MESKIEKTLESIFGEPETLQELKRMLFEMILLIARDEQLRKFYTIVFLRMEWTEALLSVRQVFDRQDKVMMAWVVELLGNAQRKRQIPAGKDVRLLTRALLELVSGLLSHCLYQAEERKEETAQIVQICLDTFFIGMQVDEKQLKM